MTTIEREPQTIDDPSLFSERPEPSSESHGPSRGDALGRYVVVSEIGRGAMGRVFKAYDELLDRAIAIKLLASGTAPHQIARLRREGQALAKLSHPNVVHVYEVGCAADRWFIAMEFVPGQTLRAWQDQRPEWRECVEVYRQAGEGLAAAHAQGLIHRDFKPDNCIIDARGRPRVLDFGLVRSSDLGEIEEIDTMQDSVSVDDHDASLTRTGTVVGTPAYMSPEQLFGRTVDARSDQFSFCASLYEGLYGQRPFPDDSMGSLTVAVMTGTIRPPPRGNGVPARLRRAVMRGMSIEPEKRWPSMDALLEELRQVLMPARRRWPLVVLGGLAAVGVGQAAQSSAGSETIRPCQGAQGQLRGVWDEPRRSSLAAAFEQTELPYAMQTWQRLEPQLDDYAQRWVAAHTEACMATSVRKEQSAEVMDLRMVCLRHRRKALSEAVDVLTDANETRVRKAVSLVSGLPELSRCEDIEALRAEVPPPEEPAVAAQVGGLRGRLTRARSLTAAWEFDQALEHTNAVVTRASTLGYVPLLAEALLLRGRLHDELGRYDQAREDLERAYLQAVEHNHRRVAASSMRMLASQASARESDFERGLWRARNALALSRALFDDARAEASALSALGVVWQQHGDTEQALGFFQRALEIRTQVLGDEHLDVADSLSNVGVALFDLGRYEPALEHQHRALAIREAALGDEHPEIAGGLNNIGNILAKHGDFDKASAVYERALRLSEKALGEEHPQVARLHNNLGGMLASQQRFIEAQTHFERALAIRQRTLGSEHPDVAQSLSNLGALMRDRDQLEDARAYFERALPVYERALGSEHPQTGLVIANIGGVLAASGDHHEALEWFRRSLAVHEQALGPEHPTVAHSLIGVARSSEALGRSRQARVHAERALQIRESHQIAPRWIAEARFELARALWSEPEQRVQARALAEQAHEVLNELGHDDGAAVATWLAEHPL